MLKKVEDNALLVSFGGHYYHPSTGGDSFTVFRWTLAPEDSSELTDLRQSLGPVLRLVDPMFVLRAMPENVGSYQINVVDDSNPALEDIELGDDLDDELEGPLTAEGSPSQGDDTADEPTEDSEDPAEGGQLRVNPVTAADFAMLARIGSDKLYKSSAGRAYGIESCDGCGVNLSGGGLFIDGSAGSAGWGNYCSECALRLNIQVGWGKGQLYAQQPDGTWEGVAGFRR